MISIKNIGAIFGSAVMSVAIVAAIPFSASAWSVNHDVVTQCVDDKAVINWTFKNTEPNDKKWSIDLAVSDAQTSSKVQKTVASGQTVSGSFISTKTKLDSGEVHFAMTWTDGRSGLDTRFTKYNASAECLVVKQPEFNVSVVCAYENSKAVYKLNIEQKSGVAATYEPSNNTVLKSGDATAVVATYNDGVSQKTITKKTDKVNDCSPKTLSTNTVTTPPKTLSKSTATTLPNTGAGGTAALLAVVFVLGTLIANIWQRRS